MGDIRKYRNDYRCRSPLSVQYEHLPLSNGRIAQRWILIGGSAHRLQYIYIYIYIHLHTSTQVGTQDKSIDRQTERVYP